MTALRSPWTQLAIHPIAVPVSRRLARTRGVTPNRVTAVSVALGLVSAGCFATGRLGWGGVLFLLRYLADCIDGMVARHQGTGSTRGAVFDIAADVCGIHLAFASLAWHLTDTGHLSPATALGLLAAVGTYNWALAHRKHLAERAAAGDGGSDHAWARHHPLLSTVMQRCRALGMTPVPWAVEAETLALGLAPLVGPSAATAALHLALVFYVIATAVNLRRVWRLATALDASPTSALSASPTATTEEIP